MGKKIEFFSIMSNILFYCSIVFMVYLFVTEDNTYKWLFAILMMLIGMVGSAIPDMMININIKGISIKLVRFSLLIKYIVFCILYTLLDKYFVKALIIVLGLGLLDVVVESLLLKQIIKTNTYTRVFIEKLNQYNTMAADRSIKYLFANIISVLFVLNTKNMFFMIIECAICAVIHIICCDKLIINISFLNRQQKKKVKISLWILQVLVMLFAILDKSLVVYSLIGFYCMVVLDLTQKNKTALIKLDK